EHDAGPSAMMRRADRDERDGRGDRGDRGDRDRGDRDRGDRRGGRRDRDRDFAPREVRAPTDTENEEAVAVEEDSE
ncbi:MAG: hypothetical protein ACREBK_01970, partial [Sphingomicrobium sp.]